MIKYHMESPNLEILKTNKERTHMTFKINNLERGMSDAMASVLRMAMYEYGPSYKPIGFSLAGVTNKTDFLKQFTEPVKQIAMNMEKINVKMDDTNNSRLPRTFRATYQGDIHGELTAGDLTLSNPSEFEIINKNLVLLETPENRTIRLDILFTIGEGYNKETDVIDDNELNQIMKDANMLPINSRFSPVERVAIKTIENDPVEDKYACIIDVKTNGTITANKLISIASEKIQMLFKPLQGLSNVMMHDIKEPVSAVIKDKTELDIPVEYMNISAEAYNKLVSEGRVALRDLKGVDGYPTKLREEIRRELKEMGLTDVDDLIVGN